MERRTFAIAAALSLATLAAPDAVLAAAFSAECGPAPKGAMCLDGPWFAFSTLKVEVLQGPVTSRYDVTLGAGRDILARTEQSTPQYSGRADVMLVDGGTIVYRNAKSLPGEGQELLNDPLLAAQEVASLLQVALPKGPKSVTKPMTVRGGGARILTAQTPAMSSYFGPPWTVEGTITPGKGGDLDFDLTLRFRIAQPDGNVTARDYQHRYRGRIGFPAKRTRIPDTMDLEGWTLNLPPGAMQGSTLGDLRRALGVPPAK
jgi:hypothetical protein